LSPSGRSGTSTRDPDSISVTLADEPCVPTGLFASSVTQTAISPGVILS
jgi:hypothetical protein